MSGIDFEKEVVRIVQECRTEDEADAEFDALTARIQDQIDADMADARSKVLETMDGEVVTKLQRRGQALSISIPEFKQRLLMVAHGELPEARFPEPGGERFDYGGKIYTTAWPIADQNDWQFFRVNEGLGEEASRCNALRRRGRFYGPASRRCEPVGSCLGVHHPVCRSDW